MRGTRRWAAAAACGASVFLPGMVFRPARVVGADDPVPRPSTPYEVRWISVGALTHPRPSFIGDRGPDPARGEEVGDETRPMFGGESEEGLRPFGSVDEVIELVKSRIPWHGEGPEVSASGLDRIEVRGPRSVLDAVSAGIADLEREALTTVVVDVLAVEGDGAAAAGEGGTANALHTGALRVFGAVRACAAPGQRVTATAGGERAYLADQSVEVAEEASTTDPIVGVLNEGLCAELLPTLSAGELRLDVHVWVAALDRLEPLVTAEGDTVERPAMRTREANASMLKVVAGAWTYLAASKDFGFAVRAGVRVATPGPGGLTLPAFPHAALTGPLETAMLDVSDLAATSPSTRASLLHLIASNLKLADPPDLAEPRPFVPEEKIVNVVKGTIDPESWETEGTILELKNRRLFARTDAAHLAGVRALLAALRGGFARSYRVKSTLVSLPLASLPELVTGLDDGAALLADGGIALLARSGARVEERASVRFVDGGRGGVEQGTLRGYLGDYDVEIAKKAAIGDPRTFHALEGVTLDVEGATTSDGTALALDLRMDRCTWRETRRVPTRHGDLELPFVGMDRVRGSLLVPLGATRLAGLWTAGDRATLVLLTATAE